MYVGNHDTRSYFIAATLTRFLGHPPLASPFKLPQSVNDTVQIEPLLNVFLPPLDLSKPIYGHFTVKNRSHGQLKKFQRIVGYREIFIKRVRIAYLLLQIEETPAYSKQEPTTKNVHDYDMCCGDCDCNFQKNRRLFSLSLPATAAQSLVENQIATGGGTNAGMRPDWMRDKPQNDNARSRRNTPYTGTNKNYNWGGAGAGRGRNNSNNNNNNKRNSKNSGRGGGHKKCQRLRQKFGKSKLGKFCKRKNTKPKKPLTPKQQAKKRIKDGKKRIKTVQQNALKRASQFTLVEPTRDKVEREQEFEEPTPEFGQVLLIEQERKKAIKGGKMIVRQLSLGSHLMFLIQGNQKDNEWLQLSGSSDGEVQIEKEKRKLLVDSREKWANPSLNYPSQKMFRSLMLFFFLLNITLRNPFTISPCNRNQIVMVHMFRSRMFLFCFSTFFLWTIFCFMILNATTLYYGTEEDDLYQKMEFNELELYYIFFWGFMINLFLAAIWSLLVLVNYSLVISNYYNLWSKAMPFLDMNPSYGIRPYIKCHLSFFLVYILIVSVSFAIDWPIVTRGTFGQVFVLTFRQMWPRVRMIKKDYFFWGQFSGLIVYFYCVWVNRTLFMFLHQFAIFLRNACQQWNLNFALRFQLVTTYYRAHLLRISSQGSLIDLYNQHRLIVGLCNYYGKAFIHPLFIYMVVNMAVVTLIMIFFIKYEEIDPATFDYNFLIQIDDSDAVIYHTLPKQDELTGVVFILLQCCIDFFQGTIGIGWGSDAIATSFEFVRRQGLLQCNSRHERRLIHSLYMSFSDIRSPLITANAYFGMTRQKIFTGLMSMLFFWTMIIQCTVEQPSALVEWVPFSTGRCEGLRMYEDSRGLQYCMQSHKYRHKMKRRLLRNRMKLLEKLKPMDTATRYLFRGDCSRQEILDDMARIMPEGLGMCKVTNINMDLDKFGKVFPRSLDRRSFDLLSKVWEHTRNEWKPPKDKTFQTDSIYPCDVKNGKFSWKDYQRDFYRVCYSDVLKVDVITSVIFSSRVGEGGKVSPVTVQNSPGNKDCGINPYVDGEEQYYVTCNGIPVKLDDCGSPNAPDFSVHGLNSKGSFRQVRLKHFPLYIHGLPEAYSENKFPDVGSIYCWDSPVASEKCKNPDMLKYCKISKKPGVTGTGYLFGKDCYNFKHFAVYVEPERSLFCLHPRNNYDFGDHWVTVGDYNAGIAKFLLSESLLLEATTTTTTTTTSTVAPGAGGVQARRAKSARKAKGRLAESDIAQEIKLTEAEAAKGAGADLVEKTETTGEFKLIQNQSLSKTRKEKKGSPPLGILGRAALSAHLLRSRNRKVKAEVYTAEDTVSRKDLFESYFPCKNSNDQVVGWLPIPFLAYDRTWVESGGQRFSLHPTKVEYKEIELKAITDAWEKANAACWDNPYPASVFEQHIKSAQFPIKEIQDVRGHRLLDECFTAWFITDTFIPDDVFAKPELELLPPLNKTKPLCWNTLAGEEHCDKNECISLT